MIQADLIRLNVYIKQIDKKKIKKDALGHDYITIMIGRKRENPEDPLKPTDPVLYGYMEQTQDERQQKSSKQFCASGWEMNFNNR